MQEESNVFDGSSGSSNNDKIKLGDGEAEDERDSEVAIYAAAKMDQTSMLSKKRYNDAIDSNNMVSDIEIAKDTDSEEGMYDTIVSRTRCVSRKKSSSAVAAKKSESLMTSPS